MFGGPFLAGDRFSAVDAFFAPVVFRYQTFELPITDGALAYCKSILALENMRLWEEQALKEPWRDEDHENELAQLATVIEDKRYG